MSKVINLIHKRFIRLLVIKRVANDKWGRARWLCECDCGNYIVGISMMHRRTEGAIFARLMELQVCDRLQYRVLGEEDYCAIS